MKRLVTYKKYQLVVGYKNKSYIFDKKIDKTIMKGSNWFFNMNIQNAHFGICKIISRRD